MSPGHSQKTDDVHLPKWSGFEIIKDHYSFPSINFTEYLETLFLKFEFYACFVRTPSPVTSLRYNERLERYWPLHRCYLHSLALYVRPGQNKRFPTLTERKASL